MNSENNNNNLENLSRLRLSKITLEGFKLFKEKFTFEIPPPIAQDDLDIIVIGGPNGSGKTTILEGISVNFLINIFSIFDDNFLLSTISDELLSALINNESEKSEIICELEYLDNSQKWTNISIPILFSFDSVSLPHQEVSNKLKELFNTKHLSRKQYNIILDDFLIESHEPILLPSFLYFNSYRKITKSNPDLQELTSTSHSPNKLISQFKMEILQALLGVSGLFEKTENIDYQIIFDKLNELMKNFIGGELTLLRHIGNELEIRIKLKDGSIISLDNLSSGEKEIISTLFLIWKYTLNSPAIILIDEPELHLHSNWQRALIRTLETLAPHNQYIITTHSDIIARSVEHDRLRMLRSE